MLRSAIMIAMLPSHVCSTTDRPARGALRHSPACASRSGPRRGLSGLSDPLPLKQSASPPFLTSSKPAVPRPCDTTATSTATRAPPSTQGRAEAAKHVVITGGTRGLGFALAQEFCRRGDRVLICGRCAGAVGRAVAALWAEWGERAASGVQCDVSSAEDVARLGRTAHNTLGSVDIWINCAGSTAAKVPLADADPGELAAAVGANVLGSLLGCREALRLMRAQPKTPAPAYHIFNLGFSGWGARLSKVNATHKATKTALAALNEALAAELAAAGDTSIGVHNLSPGMALTELLLRDAAPAARRFFNALAEEPETIAADLVPRIRAVTSSSGSISYLTPGDAVLRVLSRADQIVRGGRFFDRDGQRVAVPGECYRPSGVRLQYDEEPVAAAAVRGGWVDEGPGV